MRYFVTTDKNGYLQSVGITGNFHKDIYELNLDDYDFTEDRKHAYKLVKGELIFDPERYAEILAEKEEEERRKREEEKEAEREKAQIAYTALVTDTLLP